MSMSANRAQATAPLEPTPTADRLVDLLRHGETQGGSRFRGIQDDRLTETGRRQMRAALGDTNWDALISSPARRCVELAEEVAERSGANLEIWPEIGERDFGSWEGRTAAEIPIEELTRFWADPVGFTPAGAEPLSAMASRTRRAWQRLEEHHARRLLVVTHGGIIRVLLGALLGMPADRLILIEVPHACRSRIRIPSAGGRASLVYHRPID